MRAPRQATAALDGRGRRRRPSPPLLSRPLPQQLFDRVGKPGQALAGRDKGDVCPIFRERSWPRRPASKGTFVPHLQQLFDLLVKLNNSLTAWSSLGRLQEGTFRDYRGRCRSRPAQLTWPVTALVKPRPASRGASRGDLGRSRQAAEAAASPLLALRVRAPEIRCARPPRSG